LLYKKGGEVGKRDLLKRGGERKRNSISKIFGYGPKFECGGGGTKREVVIISWVAFQGEGGKGRGQN